MKKKYFPIIFWLLVINFIVILTQFFVPFVQDLMQGKQFLIPLITFFLLGIGLIISTIKEKVEGKLKKFLLLTGYSASGFFAAIFLHNMIYGLFIVLFGEDFWERTGLGDEPFFFLIAFTVIPIAYLIGMIGSIILLIKNKK